MSTKAASDAIDADRRRFLTAAVATAVPELMLSGAAKSQPTRLPIEGKLPSLDGAIGWLNSPPLTRESLLGKVAVIDFWTYTCINWQRQLPYVRAWAARYKDEGLVVVGVHTPEFGFEKDLANVRTAAEALKVEYPVAIDSDYAIWNAFDNQYWPALYFVDAKGNIRHHHFGEGEYEPSERVIRQLLKDAGYSPTGPEITPTNPRGAEVAADWDNLRSPESYLGRAKAQGFASPGGAMVNSSHVYAAPATLKLNQWALAGTWTVTADAVALDQANGRIVYRFHARDVNLIMGPSARGSSIRFRVFVDGRPPGAAHGVDIDEQGNGTVTEPRMYQLVRHPKPIVDRRFEIEFLGSGAEAFAFTFG
jgi:thiol-disulfide isomerase/thioredoxin